MEHINPGASRMSAALSISAAVHLVLFILLPSFVFIKARSFSPYQEVSLLRLEKVGVNRVKAPEGMPDAAKTIDKAEVFQQVPGSEALSFGEGLISLTAVKLAPSSAVEPAAFTVERVNPKAVVLPSGLPDTKIEVSSLRGAESSLPLDISHRLVEGAFEQQETIYRPELTTDGRTAADAELVTPSGMRIRGPVTVRSVIYEPPLPQADFPVEGEVVLKFWVDAGGRVSSVVPLIIVDRKLEEIAISYLREWRFNPVDGDRRVQWGMITVKFRKR